MFRNFKLNYKKPPVGLTLEHTFTSPPPIELPESFDISAFGPPIWDQGNLGSCTAHGILRSAWYALKRHRNILGKPMPVSALSRAFVYANTRLESGEPINQDDGGTVAGAFASLATDFTVDELAYTYTADHFFVKPPDAIYALAKATFHRCLFRAVSQNLYVIKHAIFTGRPVAIGIAVYQSFLTDAVMNTGVIPMPDTATEMLAGGHCCALLGWDDATQTFLMANSWSESVGLPDKRGYFKIPYAYILDPNLCWELIFCDIFY